VKERLILYNVRIDHVTIQSQLIYWIRAKVAGTAIWNCGPGTTWPKNRVFMSGLGNNLALVSQVGLLGSSWPGEGPSGRFQPGPKLGNLEPLLTLGTPELKVSAVVQQQTYDDAAAPALTMIEELMECLDIVPGISQTPQGTSWPGSSYIRLCCGNLQSNTIISGFAPAGMPNWSLIQNAKPVELVSFHLCRQPPQLITI